MLVSREVNQVRFPSWLKMVLVILLVVGVVFRFVNLNHKVYWHDEVYTTMRAAGYTRGEIDQELFQNRMITVGDLQKYQRIKPGSTIADTVRSLAVEDPQHPPLYFVMARVWMQWFQDPLPSSRLLPAVLSLLALPLMYALAWELFASQGIALLATTLLALSPFDVLFAQTARQYSLLTVAVIGSHWLLLRALHGEQRSQRRTITLDAQQTWAYWRDWGLYALSVAVGLYTHPFFGLTVVGQAVYLVLEAVAERYKSKFQKPRYISTFRMLRSFCLAIGLALVLYTPWIYVLLMNRQRALATTDWAQVFPGMNYLLQLWVLSFTSLFIDLDFGFSNIYSLLQTFLLRLPIVLLILVSFYALCRRCDRSTWLFVLTAFLVPFLLLFLPDLLLGGKRSAVSRYLISCYPSIQLAVAYFLGTHLALNPQVIGRAQSSLRRSPPPLPRFSVPPALVKWFWQGILALVVLGSLTSLTTSALSFTWWNKDLSYSNPLIAQAIKTAPNPVVISDIGDDYTNTGDLISLSYLLDSKIPLLGISRETDWVQTDAFRSQVVNKTVFVFRPTQALRRSLEQAFGSLQPVPQAPRLFKLPDF
jgi:uncharacterized membrane protein